MFLTFYIGICKPQQVCIFFFTLFILNSCVTSKGLVPQTHSFFIHKQYGIIKVDENGNEVKLKEDTVIVIYAEAINNKLTWDTAWYNNKVYHVSFQTMSNGTYEAGFNKQTAKPVTVSAKEGNFLYQLQLQLLKSTELTPHPKTELNQPLLRFRYKEKLFFIKTNNPVELTNSPPV